MEDFEIMTFQGLLTEVVQLRQVVRAQQELLDKDKKQQRKS